MACPFASKLALLPEPTVGARPGVPEGGVTTTLGIGKSDASHRWANFDEAVKVKTPSAGIAQEAFVVWGRTGVQTAPGSDATTLTGLSPGFALIASFRFAYALFSILTFQVAVWVAAS
jgi:hypothetical protein